jgi:hypothetical protein
MRRPFFPLAKELPIVSPPQVEPHRWKMQPPRHGLAPLDDDTRALLRARRERMPPREPWRFRLAFGVMLALHGLFAVVVWWEMRPRPLHEMMHVRLDNALQVRFIERAPRITPAPPPSLPPPPPPRAVPRVVHEPPAKGAMTASLPTPAPSPAPALRLFDRTGQPLLPAAAVSTAPTPGYVQRMPQGDAQVMRHEDPVKYKATRFEENFPPPDETILGQGLRSVLRATHTGEKKSVDLGHGVHLKCKTVLGIPTPDCVMPPPPPSKKDGDERLNMAPAPLAKELQPPRREPSECIALYRDGKPLPHGCPVDTPQRAVDAECGEARQAGKPLPAHCRKP